MIPLIVFAQSISPVVIVILFLLIVALAAYFFYVYRKEKALYQSEEKVLTQYERILAEAHGKARHVIAIASQKAEKLIEKAVYLNKDTAKAIRQKLAEETAQTLSLYQEELSALEDKTMRSLSETITNVENLASNELHTYRETMEKDMQDSRVALAKKREEELQKATEEVEVYKKEKLGKIDVAVAERIEELAQKLLGKSLSLSDHQELISAALSKAKEDGLPNV